jgi:hypothetical protein
VVLGGAKIYPWIAASWQRREFFDGYRKWGNMEIINLFDDSGQECYTETLHLGGQDDVGPWHDSCALCVADVISM